MNALITFFSTYIFLLSALYFLFWWVVFFISLRKDRGVQKKILLTSLIVMAITPFVEHINLADWWSPVFVRDTFFHVEDLLFGFGITGTILGMYIWFSKSVRRYIERRAVFSLTYKNILAIIATLVTFAPFYLFYIPSFYTEISCMILISACVQARIPAIILPSILTGLALNLIIVPGYFIANYMHPGWIQEYWLLTGWPGQLFLSIPLGEYVFYFFSGLFIPAFMELLFAKRSVKISAQDASTG